MKKMVFMALAAVMMLFSLDTMAQPPRGGHGHGREQATPEQMAERRAARLGEQLSLSPEQQKQIYGLQLEEVKRMREMHNHMQQGGGDREAMRDRMKAAFAERDAAYKRVLTPEQYAKWVEMEKQTRHGHGHGPQMHRGQQPPKMMGDKPAHKQGDDCHCKQDKKTKKSKKSKK